MVIGFSIGFLEVGRLVDAYHLDDLLGRARPSFRLTQLASATCSHGMS